MKTVVITEKDSVYIKDFSSFLVQLGAKPLDNPLCFEVEDHFNEDSYHGLVVISPKSAVPSVVVRRDPIVKPLLVPIVKNFSIHSGEIIITKKWFAKKLAKDAGCAHPHFAFEVISVLDETPLAYKLTLKLSAQRTSICCVCGITLTNPQSVAAGIGPICGNRWGVGMSETSLSELAEKLAVTKPITSWIPKSTIKQKI